MSAPARRAVALLALASSCAVGCGDTAAPDAGPVEGSAAPSQAPAPVTQAGPADTEAPAFAGLTEVALLDDGAFQLRWEAADDDQTPPDALRYEIFHTIEPFGEPDDVLGPLATTDPGATTYVIRAPLDTGRFFVRAIDQAGNRSGWGVVLEQRGKRPWTRAEDGTLVSELSECESFEPGRALCVGANGYAARWDRDHWTRLEASDAADLALADVADGLVVYSPLGHLYDVDPNGPLQPTPITFADDAPRTPFRQIARDFHGLNYWIDADERVFVGVDAFRVMRRPIGVEQEGCTTLRGLGFGSVAGFAICGDGAVYSVSADEPGMRWLSLTADTPVDLPRGLAEITIPHDTQATIVAGTELRRVSVGGWSVLTDVAAFGADALRRPVRHADRWYLPTSSGVIAGAADAWELVRGTEGDAVGVVAPTAIEPADQITVIYADGSVARVRYGRPTWMVEAGPTGFELTRRTADGLVALAGGATRAVFRNDGAQWERVVDAPELSDGTRLEGLAPTARGFYLYGADDAGTGLLLEHAGRGWAPPNLLYVPPPPPVDPDVGMVFDEPLDPGPQPVEPLSGVVPARLEAPAPPMTPVTAIDTAGDGRAVAATHTGQVWWRLGDGWLLIGQRSEPVSAVALDAGDAWILLSGDTSTRCWRDTCGGEVPQPAQAPGAIATWWYDAEGLTVLDGEGATWRFVPAPWTDSTTGRTTPMETTPVGSWERTAEPPSVATRGDIRERLHGAQLDVAWVGDAVVDLSGDRAITLGERSDGLALVSWNGSWALLTEIGLLTLGDVTPARPVER